MGSPEEILTCFAQTDNAALTGTFSFAADIFNTAVAFLRIPAGMQIKIFARRLSGGACIVNYRWTADVTIGTPVYKTVSSSDLVSAGEIDLEKRRPVVLRGINGTEALQVQWSQTALALSSVEFEVVFTEEGAEEE